MLGPRQKASRLSELLLGHVQEGQSSTLGLLEGLVWGRSWALESLRLFTCSSDHGTSARSLLTANFDPFACPIRQCEVSHSPSRSRHTITKKGGLVIVHSKDSQLDLKTEISINDASPKFVPRALTLLLRRCCRSHSLGHGLFLCFLLKLRFPNNIDSSLHIRRLGSFLVSTVFVTSSSEGYSGENTNVESLPKSACYVWIDQLAVSTLRGNLNRFKNSPRTTTVKPTIAAPAPIPVNRLCLTHGFCGRVQNESLLMVETASEIFGGGGFVCWTSAFGWVQVYSVGSSLRSCGGAMFELEL